MKINQMHSIIHKPPKSVVLQGSTVHINAKKQDGYTVCSGCIAMKDLVHSYDKPVGKLVCALRRFPWTVTICNKWHHRSHDHKFRNICWPMTSSVTCPIDSAWSLCYRLSIGTIALSGFVSEIFSPKDY